MDINDKETFRITLAILNDCTKKWFQEFVPKEYSLGEFRPCCTNEEKNALEQSIFIFMQNNQQLNFTNEEIIKGIIIYYYVSIVLPYYAANSAEERYSVGYVIDENATGFYKFFTEGVDDGKLYIIDNDENPYEAYRKVLTLDGKDYIRLIDTSTSGIYFMSIDGNIYKRVKKFDMDTHLMSEVMKRKTRDHYKCLDQLYTPNIRKVIDKITIGDEPWCSQIRRLIMDLNPEPFVGGKRRKKRKNKKTKKRRGKRELTRKRKYNM